MKLKVDSPVLAGIFVVAGVLHIAAYAGAESLLGYAKWTGGAMALAGLARFAGLKG